MTASFINRFNTHETPDDAIISLETGRGDIRQQILETVQNNLQQPLVVSI